MNAFEFSKEAIKLFPEFSFIREIEILLIDEPVAKIKAIITENIFINIFYNADTSKYSFALIKDNKRIFGADNAKNWHIHHLENPELHVEADSVSLLNFLKILESSKDKWFDVTN